MLIEMLFMKRKKKQLTERNKELERRIKRFSLQDSCLSPSRDTVSEMSDISNMKREIKFNRRLKNTLFATYVLSLIGIYPKI